MKSYTQKREAVEIIQSPVIVAHRLKDDGMIPNNQKLPLLTYKAAVELPEAEPAEAIEHLLEKNNWGGSWRNGIYTYHHFHSTAHEVLIVYAGTAKVQLGGERGVIEVLRAGDVLVIPAGVGHKNLGASQDFAIVGAYPQGQQWDMCYGKPGERPEADRNIARVPLPKADPIYGAEGPLIQHWKSL
jgi:uncharacterized protein YjlB